MRRIAVLGGLMAFTVAVCEVLAFWLLAEVIGGGWAVLVVLAATPLGCWLLRREGLRGWRRLRGELAAGGAAAGVVAQSAVGLAGAILVVLPGLVSDVIGLLLLGPARRWAVAAVAAPWGESGSLGPRRVRVVRGGGDREGEGPVVEGEIVD